MRVLKSYLPLFLIGFIILSGFVLFPSSSAQAVGVKFTSCTLGGLLASQFQGESANQFQEQIEEGLKNLAKKIGLNFFSTSVLENNVPVVDQTFINTWARKESRADIIARCAAREIFNAMSIGIVNNARTAGRKGGPAWIRNWQNFLTEAQYRGEGEFRAMLSKTNLCNYFSQDLKKLFLATKPITLIKNTRTGNLDHYSLRANCTMPSNFSLASYQNDFAGNGGWNAWSRMLEPQNNYYGSLFEALDETSRQRAMEQTVDSSQALANNGFIGKSGNGTDDSCETKDANGKCLAYKDIKTPGSIISDSVAATFQQELAWITNVDELSEVISAATEVLLNRLTDFSDPKEGDYTLYEQLPVPESPEITPIESPELPQILSQCSDTTDNDGDALIDWPSDPGCLNTADDDETDSPPPVFIPDSSVLLPGQFMSPGQSMRSPNGRYSFDLDMIGNLILYDTSVSPSTVLWTSGTNGIPYNLTMTLGGNLILYFDGGATTVWQSATGFSPGAHLDLSDTGDLKIYSSINALVKIIYQRP